MSPNDEKTFVRAKPKKITIEELYQYKAEIQENLALSFEKDKSQGEIKVEFVYDGERLSPGWKIAVLLQGLQSKWKLSSRIKSRIRKRTEAWRENRFAGPVVRGMSRLFGWVGHIIWWLPGHLVRRCLKLNLRPDASKSFGAPALADVERCGALPAKALVGRLALRGYSKPAFDEDWPEHCTLPLKVPVDDLESRISSSRKHVIRYQYSLEEPKKSPVRFGSVSLCDEVPYGERRDRNIWLRDDARAGGTDVGEMLELKIPLIVDIEPPDLDEKNQLKLSVARDLWEKGKRWKESREKQAAAQKNNDKEEDLPFVDQLDFFPEKEWDDSAISEALSRLSRQRGGYLFFTINSEKDEKALEKLQEEVLKIALKCSPPVPIIKPYALGRRGEQQLVIVPVPRRIRHSNGYRPDPIQIEGRFIYGGSNVAESRAGTRNGIEISWWELAFESGDRLAQALVAAANSDDGCVIVEIGPVDSYDKILEVPQLTRDKIIEQAKNCNPPMRPYIFHRQQLVNGKAALIVIPPKLPYAFTYHDEAWTLRGGKIEKMESDDIYELFKERSELHYPTLVDPPVVTYARIEWPHMDYRKRQGIRHDPENRVLEWVDKETMQQTSHDIFETTLAVKIMHPVELYQMGHVKGQIRVQFDRQTLSGLDVEYFDATGQRHPYRNERRPEIVKSTTVVINLDIIPNAIFKKRPFYPYRRLEFEGVKPDPDRLAEIISLLADLGLEDIDVQLDFPFELSRYLSDLVIFDLSDPADFEKVVSKWGVLITGYSHKRNLKVQLKVKGSPQTIRRQRKNGERIDRMSVPTGQFWITLRSEAKGGSQMELSILLNQIQHLLKERFSFVRMHLK